MKTKRILQLGLAMTVINLTGCDTYHMHGNDPDMCVNIKHEMVQYQTDPIKMRTMSIDRRYQQLYTEYQNLHCSSFTDNFLRNQAQQPVQ